MMSQLTLFGRSSSHFTRVTRLFAAELKVPYSFRVVHDLMSCAAEDYGGNPALKLPTLQTPSGVWFGALSICRELWRQSESRSRTVWPEELATPLLANAQELVLHAMATEVGLIMAKASSAAKPSSHQVKMSQSLSNTMSWLEGHGCQALTTLPTERQLSFLEVTLFCLVTHLEFREVLPLTPYPALRDFCEEFGQRPSCGATPYHYDS